MSNGPGPLKDESGIVLITGLLILLGLTAIGIFAINQYLGQLRKAEGGLSSMNTAQASNPVENLGE